jgi:hypothetical protein
MTVMRIGRDWRSLNVGRRVHHIGERALPAGLLTPSASALNIAEVAILAREVRALLDSTQVKISLQPIALVLPDLSARVALFHFEAWPTKPAEQNALLRFRFNRDLHYAPAPLRLLSRAFPLPRNNGQEKKGGSAGRQVLAVAMREDILAQYEAVCLEAGYLPIQVQLSSFLVLDRCQAFVERAIGERTEEAFFVHATPGCLFVLACRDQTPTYVRIKPMRDSHRLYEECHATLQFYDDCIRGQVPTSAQPRSLFLIGENTADIPDIGGGLNIRVQPIRWRDVGIAPNTPSTLNDKDEARAFPAMSTVWNG